MSAELSELSRRHVTSVPAALAALAAMESELSDALTYAAIRKIIASAEIMKSLFRDIDIVKAEAEDVILAAGARIGEEIAKVPKAVNRAGPKKQFTAQGKKVGRKEVMPSGTQRSRYQKLAAAKPDLKSIAKKLREQGKDATPTAVVREITHGSKAQRRATRQSNLADRIKALPEKRYGVIYGDPGWKTETYSDKGLDRSADLHYTTTALDAIKALDVASISAKDGVLFLWVTVPHLEQGLDVVRAWGFIYKSMLTWDKETFGTGHWLRNQTEHLIIATRGNVVAPGDDQKISSLFRERKTDHSVKPAGIAGWIERLYPDIPKIELNRRGLPRPGWDAWGNEAEEKDAA